MEINRGTLWEVLRADDRNSDTSAETVRSPSGGLPVVYGLEPRPGLSCAPRSGIEARRSYIIGTSDDVPVAQHWLAARLDAFLRHLERVVFGNKSMPLLQEPASHWFRNAASNLTYFMAVVLAAYVSTSLRMATGNRSG